MPSTKENRLNELAASFPTMTREEMAAALRAVPRGQLEAYRVGDWQGFKLLTCAHIRLVDDTIEAINGASREASGLNKKIFALNCLLAVFSAATFIQALMTFWNR